MNLSTRPFAVLSGLLVTSLLAVLVAPTSAPDVAAAERRFELDGKALYMKHCAGCHGANGNGKGTTKLPRPARSFKQGGLAFGDTPDQLLKTITTGIPGSNPMPSFKDTMTEDERRAVIGFVQTLLPKRRAAGRREMIMPVAERPRVIRGHLGSIVPGAPRTPRGLLVGHPGGLTFEYRTNDDVRLLGVRLGGFVERTDWRGRGGQTMKPLGKVVYLLGDGNPAPPYTLIGAEDVRARLSGSFVREDASGVSARMKSGIHDVRIDESAAPLVVGDALAFTRTFEMSSRSGGELMVEVMGAQPGAAWVAGRPDEWSDVAGREQAPAHRDWIVARTKEGSHVAVRLRAPQRSRIVKGDGLGVIVPLRPRRVTRLQAVIVLTNDWNEEIGNALVAEIEQ